MIRAWYSALAWYAIVLGMSFGYYGPGPAFAAWTVPAIIMYAWSWQGGRHSHQNMRSFVAIMLAWMTVLGIALTSHAWLPDWAAIPVWLLSLAWVVFVTERMTAAARREASSAT